MSHLKQLLTRHGISQTDLARILGRDKSVITNLIHGRRQLKADEATLIANHIGVPVTRILGIDDKQNPGFHEVSLLIPFQSEPKQSKNITNAIEKGGKYFLEVGQGSHHSSKSYALEVRDDSMNLSGIVTGDVVISELDRPCKNGQIVIAQHYKTRGAETIIRRYEAPFLLAHSTQGTYRPLSVESEEIRLVSPLLKLVRNF